MLFLEVFGAKIWRVLVIKILAHDLILHLYKLSKFMKSVVFVLCLVIIYYYVVDFIIRRNHHG